jgi:hypothetical protein
MFMLIIAMTLKFLSPTNARFIKHIKCLIKRAFVGERNFNFIKTHGKTIKIAITCLFIP